MTRIHLQLLNTSNPDHALRGWQVEGIWLDDFLVPGEGIRIEAESLTIHDAGYRRYVHTSPVQAALDIPGGHLIFTQNSVYRLTFLAGDSDA